MTNEELDYANAKEQKEQDEKDRIQFDDTPNIYQSHSGSPYSMTNAVNKYHANRYDDYIRGQNARDQHLQGWKRLDLDKERIDNDDRQKNYQNVINRQIQILNYICYLKNK
jgi:hypothetical protein